MNEPKWMQWMVLVSLFSALNMWVDQQNPKTQRISLTQSVEHPSLAWVDNNTSHRALPPPSSTSTTFTHFTSFGLWTLSLLTYNINIPVFLFLPMHRGEMLVCCLSAVLSSVLSFCTTVRYLKKKRKNYFFVIWSHFHPWLRELFIRLPQNQKTRFLWESAEWENTQIRAQSIRTNLLFSSTLSRSHTKRKLEHIKDGSRVLWSQSIKASVLFHPASTLWFSDVSVRYPDWLNVCVWRTCSVCGLHLLLTCLCVFFCQTRVSHSQARPQPPSPPNPPTPSQNITPASSSSPCFISRLVDPLPLYIPSSWTLSDDAGLVSYLCISLPSCHVAPETRWRPPPGFKANWLNVRGLNFRSLTKGDEICSWSFCHPLVTALLLC